MERKMAVCEFRDSTGREWRAWDVAPDKLDARTKDEDYLAALYYTGWIVFETMGGDEKRRLYPVPHGWSDLPLPELEVLLQKAEVVPPRKLRIETGATGESAAQTIQRAKDFTERAVDAPELVRDVPRAETPDVTDVRVVRSFRYPGGRVWLVCVTVRPDAGQSPVLRFTAGERRFDLREWPADWVDYADSELVKLLRRAAAREPSTRRGDATPSRRWDDQRVV
jgi:hypothetical protein